MIRAHIEEKYEVEFDGFLHPSKDLLGFLNALKSSDYDIVVWNNDDYSAFGLDLDALTNFKKNECAPNSVYTRYIDYIVDNAPAGASEVHIELA